MKSIVLRLIGRKIKSKKLIKIRIKAPPNPTKKMVKRINDNETTYKHGEKRFLRMLRIYFVYSGTMTIN